MVRQPTHEVLTNHAGGAEHGYWNSCAHMAPSTNSRWAARTAISECASSTTKDIPNSVEPCAIAITLTPLAPMQLNNRPATPGVPAMPAPTTVTIATGVRDTTASTSVVECWSTNCLRRTVSTLPRSVPGITKHILLSDEACEIISTFPCTWATALNTRAAAPTTPDIPTPCTVTSARS